MVLVPVVSLIFSDEVSSETTPLIHITARRRTALGTTGKDWDGNFVGAVRHSLAARFDPATQPIALGGVFVVKSGKVRVHVMVRSALPIIFAQNILGQLLIVRSYGHCGVPGSDVVALTVLIMSVPY